MFNPLRRDTQIAIPGVTKAQAHMIEAGIIMLHPHSRGRLQLRSADPSDKPQISLNVLSDARDLETMIGAIRMTRKIYRAGPLADLLSHEVTPGTDVESDAQLANYVRQAVYTVRHGFGSCRMGTEQMAVVDPELRVRGIDGLRVADASIMPTIPGAGTNAPAIMIGERAADLIRRSHMAR